MTPPYVVIHKERGETPLGAIEQWKASQPHLAKVAASYAGRLDPMAEGKLLVLLGEECKKQKKYTKLDKEYEIEIALDLATDTGDVLGLPSYVVNVTEPSRAIMGIGAAIAKHIGTHQVPYPAFSSKPVAGKPLFLYALEGTLDSIQIPEHEETIYRAKVLSLDVRTSAELAERIEHSLVKVPRTIETSKRLGADFRQELVRAGWRALFSSMPERDFMVIRLRVACASGAYMRTLATRIAKELDTTAIALSIKRTKIGTYKRFGPLSFWTRKY